MANPYQRRGGPVDYPVQRDGNAPNRSTGNEAADSDYFGNFRKFERHDDMAAEPTRDKTQPSRR